MTDREAIMRAALARIRDDYGEVWGGCSGPESMTPTCMVCGETADDYTQIPHDIECAVTLARVALERADSL